MNFFWSLVSVAIFLATICCGFPDDLSPKKMLLSEETSAFNASFSVLNTGNENTHLYDVQASKWINGNLVLGARNAIYVVKRTTLLDMQKRIAFDQAITWLPANDTKCEMKTGSVRTCQNYIRLIQPLSATAVLVCGTNAAKPTCREYQWETSRFTGLHQPSVTAMQKLLPFDDLSTTVYKYTGGNMFIATRNDLNRLEPVVARSSIAAVSPPVIPTSTAKPTSPLTTLKTVKNNKRFANPQFAGMVETADKMFVFFREEASEASNHIDQVIFPRVAQVCKSDIGEARQEWTTFFKARLNCSFPGARPFYFSELQHVTNVVSVGQDKVVFATVTTPEHSFTGSAVCAFSLRDISAVFSGSFWEQDPKSICWSKTVTATFRHPATCRNSTAKALTSEEELFILKHPIMSGAVPALGGKPLFALTQSRTRLTAIAAESNLPTKQGFSVTMLYIGTKDGKLLKVVTRGFNSQQSQGRKTVFSEEWAIFQNATCTRLSPGQPDPRENDVMEVKKILIVPDSDMLLVTFRHCVLKIPKHMCRSYKCKSNCVQSGNPYCGWVRGECRSVTASEVRSAEQDIFSDHPSTEQCTEDTHLQQLTQEDCPDVTGFVLPLVLGIVASFTLVISIFFLCIWFRGTTKLRSKQQRPAPCSKGDPSLAMANLSAMEQENGRRLLQREGSRSAYSASGNLSDAAGSPSYDGTQVLNNVADDLIVCTSSMEDTCVDRVADFRDTNNYPQSGVGIVGNMTSNNSVGCATWSNDFAESDAQRHLSYHHSAYSHSHGSNRDESLAVHYNANNNRAVGVARPMAHQSSSKLSQIVRPTFVGKQSARIKLGSQQLLGYGSTRSGEPPSHTRIMTNPNYLPVSPCVSRVADDLQRNVASSAVPSLAEEELRERQSSGDSSFPPPPPFVLSPEQDVQNSSSTTTSTSWYPSPASEQATLDNDLDAGWSSPSAPAEVRRKNSSSTSRRISSSASAESTTSGCFSSSVDSPQIVFKDKTSANRKALIVAKGILSAQSCAPLKGSKKSRKKFREAKSQPQERYSVSQQQQHSPDYDKRSSVSDQRDSMFSEDLQDGNFQPSPEFQVSSADDLSPQREDVTGDVRKFKRSLKLFKGRRSRKGSKKGPVEGVRITDEDTFVSPAYDEEPFVPIVEGWQEIEYASPANFHDDPVTPTMTSFQPHADDVGQRRAYDDACIGVSFADAATSHDYNFYTMRPKSRRRQQMPKMRNTHKEWALTNNPLPVPTPALPDAT